ncbi:MAG: hypothetical protein M9942_04915 [Microthrixaceae bacterium]|nr:hypothetical protein [Microthrixaceae bacterium]MCO5317764.1 hypothetical protein [Microthrixaceae bacterium]
MPRVYIHEVVEVDGTRRADYQHHMTANWVPESAAVRRQRCFGVFTLVGSTGPWPRVVNLWEYDSWEDLAHNFSHELGTPGHRDPALARWWAAAASFRKGGHDRILVEHPSNPGVQHWESRGGTAAAAYLHEVFTTPVGGALRLAEELAGGAVEAMSRWAIEPVGLWHTAMRGDDEVVALWRVPDWDSWSAHEGASASGGGYQPDGITGRQRWLLVDAQLSPLRTGRQPTEADRRPLSRE